MTTPSTGMEKPQPVRALSLLSGGLDSQLAVRALQSQGIEVHAIVFKSVFFNTAAAVDAGKRLNIPVLVEEFTAAIVSLVQHPRHGFGAGLNPCIDCHIAMIRRAGQIMDEEGFHLISTGEVLNQRPMSQNRKALERVAQESGYGDVVLRPLSAKLLPETEPEKKGWVDRDKLLALEGRSRKAQIVLAMKLGVADYPQPAGGCLLTDPGYARRLKDLKEHEGLGNIRDIDRLRMGRHFRVGTVKLIVGRHQDENRALETDVKASDLLLRTINFTGPVGLLPATATEQELRDAAAICARYSDCPPGGTAMIEIRLTDSVQTIEVRPAEPDCVEALRI